MARLRQPLGQARLQSVTVPEAARCIGQTLDDQALHAVGVRVLSLRRHNGKAETPDDAMLLLQGDTLVLSGRTDTLAQDFVAFAVQAGVLRFGEFRTKAGRLSPYFFNAGLFDDGAKLGRLAQFYARRLQQARAS